MSKSCIIFFRSKGNSKSCIILLRKITGPFQFCFFRANPEFILMIWNNHFVYVIEKIKHVKSHVNYTYDDQNGRLEL